MSVKVKEKEQVDDNNGNDSSSDEDEEYGIQFYCFVDHWPAELTFLFPCLHYYHRRDILGDRPGRARIGIREDDFSLDSDDDGVYF